jgi:isopentenyl-diphosphate delta-isomerase
VYRAEFDNGLIEHELDHVLVGQFDGTCVLNPEEVAAVKWISMEALFADVEAQPEQYTAWFKIILAEYAKHLPQS